MSSIKQAWRRGASALLALMALSGSLLPIHAQARTQPNCRFFPETAKEVCGLFLNYWNNHGDLPQQGLPLTGEFSEVSDVNGKTYTVQYFERAVFEKHPENKPPYDVLLSLLGTLFYNRKYPTGATNQQPNTSPGSILFSQTGKRLSGKFLEYWNKNGGIMQQGYPISDEFIEKGELDGKTYRVQYFERAVFEFHPENAGTPHEVLLSQLGAYYVKQKYPNGEPDAWSPLRKRPFALPKIAPGERCPTSTGSKVAPEFGLAFGSGPIYAVLDAESDALVQYDGSRQEGGWFYSKTLWIGSPSFRGPVLVRGGQVDGPNELHFGDGPTPSASLQLLKDEKSGTGWADWPSQTRLRTSGCYAFQVDGPSFSQLVIFKAVAASQP